MVGYSRTGTDLGLWFILDCCGAGTFSYCIFILVGFMRISSAFIIIYFLMSVFIAKFIYYFVCAEQFCYY